MSRGASESPIPRRRRRKPKTSARKIPSVKMRTHCSHCGVETKPSTYCYCSRACQDAASDLKAGAESQITEEALVRHQELARQLEDAPAYLRDEIREEMARVQKAALEVPSEKPRHRSCGKASDATVEHWADLIRPSNERHDSLMRRGLVAAIKLGERLLQARERLPYGEFGRLFADHENPVRRGLTIKSRWGRVLMSIARHRLLADRQHAAVLPADIKTVEVLTRIDEDQLEQWLADGTITPSLTRAEAMHLLPPLEESSTQIDPIDRVLAPIQRRVARFAEECPDRLADLKGRLNEMLAAVEAATGETE